ncbi:hypothetical protein [Tabrizicola sp.]|uniref:hypothetical protein n=1 Tax=Tabrizicola sp. TaxID=2005166 RepID=UPI003F3AA08F
MKSISVLVPLGAVLGGLLVLAGCVSTGGTSTALNKYSTPCMFEVDPPGAYVWSDGDSEVKPGGGGTAEGAAAMNDCIRKKAAAAGETMVTTTSTERSAVVESEGTVTETYTYGQPPSNGTAPETSSATGNGESCRRRNVLSGGTGYFGCS